MERGAALMDFVGTVIDAVSDIANGGVGGVPAKIEAALGKAVPLVIAFLANLLGLGGISEKIKSILKAVQAPINKALDFVIKGALKLAGPLIKGIKGIGGKIKAKAKAGIAKVKDRLSGAKNKEVKGESPDAKKDDPSAVKKEAGRQLQPKLASVKSADELRAALTSVMANLRPRGLHRLHVVDSKTEGTYEVHAVASPGEKVGTVKPQLNLDLGDIDVTVAKNQFVTVAKGFINHSAFAVGRNNTPVAAGADLETLEQQGRHAEASVLDRLEFMVTGERFPVEANNTLELFVTRTPCNECTNKIDRIRRLFKAKGGNLDVTVKSLALYQGSRDAARNEETGRGTKAGGTFSLRRLHEMQIKVEAWDLQRDARRLFGPNVDMKQVDAVAGRLNGKVEQLRAVIKSLPLIDIT